MLQMHAIIKGKVQGVFFRATVKEIADRLHIFGYVKNLPDASVEVVAIGEKDKLETFIETVKKHPGRASISAIDYDLLDTKESFHSFEIRYE